jgi:hypothetical protein
MSSLTMASLDWMESMTRFLVIARHYKINVVLILVYVIPDYMLNVFRNNIHIVYNHGFFLPYMDEYD